MSDVELSVTVWERTWESALTRAFFARITDSLGRDFDRTTVTINNVRDPASVRARASELIGSGVIDDFVEVSDHLDAALEKTGLSRRELEPLPWYTDHFLVKVCAPGPRWLVHWDTDIVQVRPGDWVTPSIQFLNEHPDVVVAGPGWSDERSMRSETLRQDGEFNIGYGFTDQIFMVERERFAAPIYDHFTIASWWYPTAHITPIFEQRIDAWMRRKRLPRATYRAVTAVHDERMVDQPRGTRMQRMRRIAQLSVYRSAQRLPVVAPRLRRNVD